MLYVDITKKSYVSAVEWFHGYGGNALGLGRAIPGLRSVAVCERDAFVVANMVSKMEKGLLDAVPIWTDVTDFPTEPFGHSVLDLFVASYPCQGFSHAGKRLGKDDPRHLWPYCRKFIGAVRPRFVWLENVEGHVTLGLSTVLADLEEDGYTAAWGIFSASEVGAPHQRKRVFILAYRRDDGDGDVRGRGQDLLDGGTPKTGSPVRTEGIHGPGEIGANSAVWPSRPGASGEDVAHVVNEGLQGHAGDVHGEGREPGGADRPVAKGGLLGGQVNEGRGMDDSLLGGCECLGQVGTGREAADLAGEGPGVWPSRPGASQYGWEPPRVVGNAAGEARQRKPHGETGQPSQSDESGVNSQTQPPLGGNADGPADGLDFPGCTGLGDKELAEIREWMVKGTNRTDELRMCGNGVVPQTAERAFRVLYRELIENRK